MMNALLVSEVNQPNQFNYLQWLRFIQVIVGKQVKMGLQKVGMGLDVRASHDDGLRITATVEKTIRHTPNTADITLWNLAPADEHMVLHEYDDVIINAGYARKMPEGANALELATYNVHQVFRGNLKHAVAYWDSGDRKVDIQAADGDKDYKLSYLNTYLPAGATDAQVVAAALGSMPNTTGGQMATSPRKLLRGKVISEPTRETLHRAAANVDAHWSIQDGELQIVKSTGVLQMDAVVLNYDTGLLEAPALSDKGIQVVSLLNPLIAINGRLLLNNGDIKIQTFQLYTHGAKVRERKLTRLNEDGVYKVYSLRHDIDSRGDAKTTSQCVAVGDSIPPTSHKTAAPRL